MGELSRLHQRLASEGLSEVFVDQMAITKYFPTNRRSVIMVAFAHFFPGNVMWATGLKLEVANNLRAGDWLLGNI